MNAGKVYQMWWRKVFSGWSLRKAASLSNNDNVCTPVWHGDVASDKVEGLILESRTFRPHRPSSAKGTVFLLTNAYDMLLVLSAQPQTHARGETERTFVSQLPA